VAHEPAPSTPRLVLVAHDDPATADSLRHAAESTASWQALVADPSVAGLTAALAVGPSVALVGCESLANLPAGCRTPLVAVGDDDRPADGHAACSPGPTAPPTCQASSPGSPPPPPPARPTTTTPWSS
jgi:hypothetical protein